MSVLPDYTYVDGRGGGNLIIRTVGALTKKPANALNLSESLGGALLDFTRRRPEISYVMFGLWMSPAGAPATYGRENLAATLDELGHLTVQPSHSVYQPAPPVMAGKRTGHSLWVIGWPVPPSSELATIVRVLEGRGLLTTLTFRREEPDLWLMENLSQRLVAKALQLVN